MIRARPCIGVALPLLIAFGCGGANLRKSHEGALLDNKVLQQRVEAALRREGKDFQKVHVAADGGTVTLSGSVASTQARGRAEAISRGVYGVEKTENEINLQTPSSAP
jgi:osmotically-inducible protein OsmY